MPTQKRSDLNDISLACHAHAVISTNDMSAAKDALNAADSAHGLPMKPKDGLS
jgi:hypothetical protein